MEKFKDIVAVMATKTYPENEVGVLRKVGESEEGLVAGLTPEREVEFFSECDFEEPCRQNFEDVIKKIVDGDIEVKKNVEIKFLTEIKES